MSFVPSASWAQSLFLGSNRTGTWVNAAQPASGQLQLGLAYGGSASQVTFYYQMPGASTWGPAQGTMIGGPPGSPNWVSSPMPMSGAIDGTLRVRAEVRPYGQPVVTVGPVDFSLTNLTVDAIRCEAAQGGAEVVEAGELFTAVTSPTAVDYEVDLLDGYECPSEASATLTLKLLPLGVGQQREATATGTAPTTMTGVFGTSLPIGFYYKEATASEQVTYDTASNLSSFWHLTNAAVTGYEYMSGRKARITVGADLDTAALPSAAAFAWCKPLPTAAGRPVPPGVLTVPAAAYTVDLGDVLVTFGGSTGLDLSVAGVHRLAMAFRDTRQYHAPGVGRWTAPQAVAVEIPAATCWSPDDSGFSALVQYAYARLGACIGAGNQGATFYSGAVPLNTRGGAVANDGTKANFLAACTEDEVLYVDCHGSPGAMTICVADGSVLSTDVQALPAGSMTDMRLTYLSCCYSLTAPSGGISVAHAMYQKGAKCVVGYDGHDFAPSTEGDYFNQRLWVHWTMGSSIGQGIADAQDDLQSAYGFLGYAANIGTLGQSGSTIAPAFTYGQ